MSARSDRKDIVFIGIAKVLSQLGTCDRAHVGALIVKDGRCISWGYNGAPPGVPHCDENGHGWQGHESWRPQVGFESEEHLLQRLGCRNSTHAETNAVAFAARQGISTDGGTLYVTHTPCRTCSMTLVAAGIVRVVAATRYDRDSGLSVLQSAGIEVVHFGEDQA